MKPPKAPFVPKKACSQEQADLQEYFKLKKQVSLQATNPGKKNDNNNNQMVAEWKQYVDWLVDLALKLTWDICFDGTQVVFKEPETLTVIREELSLNPTEEGLLRAMGAGKFRTLSALKLREPRSKEADRLATKISPMDYRLKREQDVKKLKKFIRYRHILHAPKGSSTLSACGCSLGYHELLALSVFQQWGVSFGTERGRGPGSREVLLPDRHFDEKRSHFRYFIDRMRGEVVEKRGHLVTTEADLKLGTFLGEGTGSGYVFETCMGEGGRKNLGAIGDGRPVVKGKETGKEGEEEAMEEVGPVGGGAPLTAPE
ncbi:hypothetical protein B0T13DRAFT_517204 [Neurospora crassa]|nr:hypothetical protein B0T13DRAFT_517204 [Neurospora crassa]